MLGWANVSLCTKSTLRGHLMNAAARHVLGCFLYTGVCLAVPVQAGFPARITIDAGDVGPTVNPRMYGIFLEEINHGVDGGLYAEMIRNRGFEDSRPPEGYHFVGGRWVDPGGFDSGFGEFGYTTDGIPFWTLSVEGDARGSVHLETSGGVTDASSYCAA